MKSAYYSKNNSFSKSYNAEYAEEDGRFPRTRAAAALGLSTKAFDAGCVRAGYVTSEWHHVGKYANKVDYYDTNELAANPLFWLGARTKTNRFHVNAKLKQVAATRMWSRLKAPAMKKTPAFSKALIRMCEGKGKMLENIVRHLDTKGYGRDQYIEYGSYMEDEMRFRSDGSFYYTGSEMQCSAGGYITPFHLTNKNIKSIIRAISLKKHEQHLKMLNRSVSHTRYSFIPENVLRIIARKKHSAIHGNTLVHCQHADWLTAAKILSKTMNATFTIENERVNIVLPVVSC